VWGLGAEALGDGDDLANVYSSVVIADVGGVANRIFISPETAALDPGNVQQIGDMLPFFATRNASTHYR
jgi:hypothetical protein